MNDLYLERQVLEEVLNDIPLKQWRDYDGDWLLDFFLHLKYPRKIARIIRRVCLALRGARPKTDNPELQNIVARFIVAGCRGGGKSMADAAIEFVAWVFIDADVVNVGGSEIQAQNVYAYLQGFLGQYSEEIERWSMGGRALPLDISKETMSKTIRKIDPLKLHTPTLVGADGEPIDFVGVPLAKDTQAFIAVCAASQKQVRGPHAGSEMRAGLLVVDEEGEVDADIFNAAKYMINTAHPAVMLRTSTYHMAVGTFAEDFEDPDQRGFERHRFSIFDIAKTCPWAKTTPEQWSLLDAGKARAPGDDWRGLLHLPVLQPDCSACPKPEYFRDHRYEMDGKTGEMKVVGAPWCGGAAAYAKNGWIDWETDGGLLQQFRDRANDEEFEVELCGLRPSTMGYVIKDRDSLKSCFVDDDLCAYLPPYDESGRYNEGAGECIATIDWGLKGQCAVTVLQNRTDLNMPFGCRVAIEIEDLGMQSEGVVYAYMEQMRDRYGVNEIWADSSHPYNNLALRERGFQVEEVFFAKDKETGAGSINAHIENAALMIPRESGKIATQQLLKWRRDKNGKIVKGDDHFCDSLLCGLLRYLHMVAPRVSDMFAQRTQASQVNRQAQAPAAPRGRRGETAAPISEGSGAAAVNAAARQLAPPMPRQFSASRAPSLFGNRQSGRDFTVSIPAATPQAPAAPGGESPTERIMREAREKARRR